MLDELGSGDFQVGTGPRVRQTPPVTVPSIIS